MTRVPVLRVAVVAVASLCLLPPVAMAADSLDPDVEAETLLSRERFLVGDLTPAGDVNGDGHDDVIVRDIDANEDDEGLAASVLFGPLPAGEPTYAQVVANGFEVRDPVDFFHRRPRVEGIGDVNGDGRDDVLVERDASHQGAAVVFGSAAKTPVDMDALGGRGFHVDGVPSENGDIATGLGDVNGDGRDDFAVQTNAGATVVFGKATLTPVDLTAPGAGGYRVEVPSTFSNRRGMGGGMDFDGDGRGDLVVDDRFGRAWVVYGKATTEPVDLTAPGAAAVTILAPAGETFTGATSEAGDVNGDGLGDVVLGLSKRAVVVYGRASNATITAGALGTGGFLARNGTTATYVEWVKPAGDVNADGLDDVVVTVSTITGIAATVVYGKAGTAAVNLALPGVRGFKVYRRPWVQGIGDVVGDERPDLGGEGFAMSPPHDEPGGDCTITGTAGPNVLTGTPGPDVICGLGGNDLLNGLGGDDVLAGGVGADRLNGGEGDDRLAGAAGADSLRGDAGADRIAGGSANDVVDGGAGDDAASGGEGGDTLRGGLDGDRLLGYLGNDRLYGEAGEDTIDGERDGDTIDGGADDDRLLGGGSTDTVLGGLGDDVIRGDEGSWENSPSARDNLRGGAGDDDVNGDWGNDSLFGDAGNDVLDGWDGNDTLRGGLGDDDLTGLTGRDSLAGEAGADTLHTEGDGLRDTSTCGAGLDAITFDLGLDAVGADCETRTGV